MLQLPNFQAQRRADDRLPSLSRSPRGFRRACDAFSISLLEMRIADEADVVTASRAPTNEHLDE
jgi:hypothetical protein